MSALSEKRLLSLVKTMTAKLCHVHGPTYRVAAAAFSKKGNLIGIETNGWRELATVRRGTGRHAEATLMKRYGKKIDTIYILRVGRALDILPIHPCESCSGMAKKLGVKVVPIHEVLNLY